jgi:hypothetical protein
MNERLLDVIRYKCGGRQTAFAHLMGWTPQYVGKLLRGENFGLSPVLRILEVIPELDARWLLLGQGSMLMEDKVSGVRRDVLSHVQRILDLERFICVMSPDELQSFEKAVSLGSVPQFGDEVMSRWSSELKARNEALLQKVNSAMSKSVSPCSLPKVK